MQTAELIAKYDQRVPRYTSYPTAPHFTPAVDGETYAGWLRALPDGTALSLYLHVPFCARLCLFCGCHTTVVHRPEPLEAYARTLLAEIDLVAATIGRRVAVRQIHWGGGTPTALPPEQMRSIDACLRQRFDLQPDTEIALEVDPRTLDGPALEALARIGVTRASLGVQDFDPVVQQAIGREQSSDTTAECAERLRGIGVRSLNLDLIYGLPYQTVGGVGTTVREALTLTPDRVAMFGYAHVPWMKKHQALLPEAALPDAAARYAQCRTAESVIRNAGYNAIGLDHFALPIDTLSIAVRTGTLRRNFQGYTTDDAPVLLGLGASSIGNLPRGYVQNAPAVPAWRDAIRAGRLPTARGIALSEGDMRRRAVIERIMCDFTADVSELMDDAQALRDMESDGLIRWDGTRLAVTDAGRPFVRTVAAAFDAYLRAGGARHSAAV